MTKVELLDELEKLIEEMPNSRIAGEGIYEDCQRWANERLLLLLTEVLLRHATVHPTAWNQVHESTQEVFPEGLAPLHQDFRQDAKRQYLKRLRDVVSRMS